MPFDRRRQFGILAGDLRRQRDTLEKLNAPVDRRVTQAAALVGEAAALLDEATQPTVEHFGR